MEFKDRTQVELSTTKDSNYMIYLQSIIRNESGQLINITENSREEAYVAHKLTDHIFDTLMGEKEIITINNIIMRFTIKLAIISFRNFWKNYIVRVVN